MQINSHIQQFEEFRRLIISDGFKIAPDTIEDIITDLSYVKECIVVGVPDEKLGNVPMAFVELDENVNFEDVYEDIKEKCEKTLPAYEVPAYFEQIDKIPYTPNGKHDFRKLEELGKDNVKSYLGNSKILKR